MAIARSEAVKAVLKEAEEMRLEAAGEKQAEETARKVRFAPHLYLH